MNCPPAESSEKADVVMAERKATYSPTDENRRLTAEATGLAIRSVLQAHWQKPVEDIPPHVVYQIIVALKLVRAALPFKYNDDNYIDMDNYLKMAKSSDPRSSNDPT